MKTMTWATGMSRAAGMIVIALGLAVAGCSRAGPSPLPVGPAAYAAIPVSAPDGGESALIRSGDRLSIRVFGEPELTSNDYRVDSTGLLQVPLVGDVEAAGMSPLQLSQLITTRLGARYVRDPKVTVGLIDRPSATYAVEGNVMQPGIFVARPNTTLLGALAEAKSPSPTANLSEVMVFRVINGQRAGGRFDLQAIRRGRAPDPQILAGDTVVVGNSALKSAWRDFLAAAPVFGLFSYF